MNHVKKSSSFFLISVFGQILAIEKSKEALDFGTFKTVLYSFFWLQIASQRNRHLSILSRYQVQYNIIPHIIETVTTPGLLLLLLLLLLMLLPPHHHANKNIPSSLIPFFYLQVIAICTYLQPPFNRSSLHLVLFSLSLSLD